MLDIQILNAPNYLDEETYKFYEELKEKDPNRNRCLASIRFYETFDYDAKETNIQLFFRHDECRFLSEALTVDDIEHWKPSQPVFISSQTGAGKSTFVFDELLRYVVELRKCGNQRASILLLSNRIALNRQMRMAVAKRIKPLLYGENLISLEEMEKSNPENLDAWSFHFPMITLTTYQSLRKNVGDLWQYQYIVSDEAHFFTSDSTFNAYTEDIMKHLIRDGQNSVRLYLSATPEIVFEPVIREEYRNFAKRVGRDMPMNIFYYNMARDYSYIEKFFYFDNDEEIFNVIQASNEKWLIFVDSCNQGRLYEERLSQAKSCVFVSKESKNSGKAKEIFDEIIEKEMFSVDILVATSVLDNGINIKNDCVHNIVIEVFDKTEFIQMLGRIRRVDNTKLNLFIKLPSVKKLKKHLTEIKESLAQRLLCDIIPMNEKEDIVVNNIIYTSKARRYNHNVIYQLIDSIYRLQRMIDGMRVESCDISKESFSLTERYQIIYQHFSRTWREILKLPWRNEICRIFFTPNFWEGTIDESYLEHTSFANLILGKLMPAALANEEKMYKSYLLADDSAYRTPLAEIMRWIGKNADDCMPFESVSSSINSAYDDGYFMKFVATQDDIDVHRSKISQDSTILEKEWLQSHGIGKGSQDERKFLERYMPKEKSLRGNTKIVDIPSFGIVQVQSYRTTGNKMTFFLLVPISED